MDLAQTTLDIYGRPLQEGDEVMLLVTGPIAFKVVRLAPVLDPKAPANMLQLDLQATLRFVAARGQANREFVLVRTVEEQQPLKPEGSA